MVGGSKWNCWNNAGRPINYYNISRKQLPSVDAPENYGSNFMQRRVICVATRKLFPREFSEFIGEIIAFWLVKPLIYEIQFTFVFLKCIIHCMKRVLIISNSSVKYSWSQIFASNLFQKCFCLWNKNGCSPKKIFFLQCP